MGTPEKRRAHWRANIRVMVWLLAVWAFVSFGCSIFFADFLDRFRLGGFKLGFWMAQQGSIYTFVVLIWVYVHLMNRIDRKYGVRED